MYRNAYQRGLLTIFFSGGTNPLNIWEVHTKDGYISRFLDQEIKSMVLDIGGTNVSTSYIICPKGKEVLGITMPFLIMVVKNLKKYFSFEVTILDDTSTRRRFRVSNFQSTTQILPLCTAMPIGLSEGWNQIQFNLAEFTRRAYKKQFIEVQKLKINANIRLRRIYFAERLLPEDDLPAEYKLYFPLPHKALKDKKNATQATEDKENVKPSTSQQAVKPADAVPSEGKVPSETKIKKLASRKSVHSIMKVSSQTSKKSKIIEVIPEVETPIPEQTAEAVPAGETQPTAEEKSETGNTEDAQEPEGSTEVAAEPAAAAEAPAAGAPAAEAPAAEAPAAEAPAAEEPAAEEPAAEAVATEALVAEASAAEPPAIEAPAPTEAQAAES